MIRLLLVVALLAGCTSQPAAPAPSKRLIMAATLSTNECEATIAPTATAAQIALERAERSGRNLPEVRQLNADARDDLAHACRDGQLDSLRLASAQATVEKMQR